MKPAPAEAAGPSAEFLKRARRRMADIDALPPETRALVHEYGWSVIHQFLLVGVKQPHHIEHLIRMVLAGSTQFGNGGGRQEDYLRGEVARWMPDNVIVPREPTREMIQASIDAVPPLAEGQRAWLSKWEKHRARLRAALRCLASEAA